MATVSKFNMHSLWSFWLAKLSISNGWKHFVSPMLPAVDWLCRPFQQLKDLVLSFLPILPMLVKRIYDTTKSTISCVIQNQSKVRGILKNRSLQRN